MRAEIRFLFINGAPLAGNPWDVPLVNIIREQLWMYKISPEVMDVLVEKVKSFYFGKKNHGRNTISQLVDVSNSERPRHTLVRPWHILVRP